MSPATKLDRSAIPAEKACEKCGTTMRREDVCPPQSLIHWMARRYCSVACARRDQPTGEASPHWKAGARENTGRKRAQKLYPDLDTCAHCGAAAQCRHHDDENPLNNDPLNIVHLCNACHTRHHNPVLARWRRRRSG